MQDATVTSAAPSGQTDYRMFKVGSWIVQPQSNTLVSGETKVSIEPKMMDVLTYLCENEGQVVSTEQLLIACWKGTFYGDAPVQKCIAVLRKKLGCNARQPSYIETVHRRGYKIIASVSFSDSTPYLRKQQSYSWDQGSPYMGLNAFQFEHAPIYFGRTKAVAEVIQKISTCCKQQLHFLLLLGKSGIGKSSLMRAGVLPYLHSDLGFGGIKVSRYHILMPRQGNKISPTRMLVDALVDLDLLKPTSDRESLSRQLEHFPELLAAELNDIPEQLVTEEPPTKSYRLLVIDQFEQFILDDTLSEAAKVNLVACMSELARRPNLFLVAMLRNDFYANCVEIDGFTELKSHGGQYDLQPAKAGEIAKMIRHPAFAAGLEFEVDEVSGERLDDLLLDAAVRHPDALPLLEYTLDLLYQQRSDDNQLLLSAYHDMGGVEGAIAKQAELTFQQLPASSQQCWHKIMHNLVKIDPTNSHAITARKMPIETFSTDAERVFVEHFINARLFVSERRAKLLSADTDEGLEIMDTHNHTHEFISVAHEALLKQWQRIQVWVDENRSALKKRIQLANDCQRWLEEKQSRELLLTEGKKINDALWLIQRPDIDLSSDERQFVQASRRREARQTRIRQVALATLVLLFMVSSGLAVIATQQTAKATASKDKAEGLIEFMLGDLREQLDPIGKLNVLQGVGEKALAYYQDTPDGDLMQQANSLKLLAEINVNKSEFEVAKQQLEQALVLINHVDRSHPDDMKRYLFLMGNVHYWLGLIPFYLQDYTLTQQHWLTYLDYAQQLLSLDPNDIALQSEIGHGQHNLGAVASTVGDTKGAKYYFDLALATKRKVLEIEPTNFEYFDSYIATLGWWVDIESAEGQINAAIRQAEYALQLADRFLATDSDNFNAKYLKLVTANVLHSSYIETNQLSKLEDGLAKLSSVAEELLANDVNNEDWYIQVMLFKAHRAELLYWSDKGDMNINGEFAFSVNDGDFENKVNTESIFQYVIHVMLLIDDSFDSPFFSDYSDMLVEQIESKDSGAIALVSVHLMYQLALLHPHLSDKFSDYLTENFYQSEIDEAENLYKLVGLCYSALLRGDRVQVESILYILRKRGYRYPYLMSEADKFFQLTNNKDR